MRALRTIADQIFVSNKILTGQFFTVDGSIIYEQIESIFAANIPQPIQPGDEFPMTPVPTGPAQIASVVKWGLDTILTDESISRQNFDVLARAFTKIVNSMVQQIDSVNMSAIVGAITQTVNAGASSVTGASPSAGGNWSGVNSEGAATTPRILRDVMFAEELMRSQKQGYNANGILVDLQTYANVVGDPTLAALLPREGFGGFNVADMPALQSIATGLSTRLFGKTWYSTPNLPTGPFQPYAAVIDTTVFGALVDERLPAPGYVGSEGDGGDDDGRGMIQVKTMREDKNDRWRIRCRRVTVPIIIEPKAAVEIVGV
jgi:hypothetical protein